MANVEIQTATSAVVNEKGDNRLGKVSENCCEHPRVYAVRDWDNQLREALKVAVGEGQGRCWFDEYGRGFPNAYREHFDARTAVQDIETLLPLVNDGDIAMSFYQPEGAEPCQVRFKVFCRNRAIELSDAIPVLENLGLRVIGEHPYPIRCAGGDVIWLHDFNLVSRLAVDVEVQAVKTTFQEAFAAIWSDRADCDAFNRLILGARLNWREVTLLRAYARYMKQTAFNFSQTYIANTLVNHQEVTRNLVALFKSRFDPRLNHSADRDPQRIERLQEKIIASLDRVDNLNDDRIVRRYLDMMMATLRTNFFQTREDGAPKPYISLKLSPRQIADIPEPRPLFEIFVYSPRMEGVHLRGGKVARGGLRWSDRLQDYRTEVLGLVKAQQVKNAVIVPSGAKGGFVAKRLPLDASRAVALEEGIACYKTFIRGLLDVTDNRVDGVIVRPPQVICQDEEDPYLVVAADKGTATFSDVANGIAEDYGFWLGDAFASGGSQGYDHKGMGITARGAWVSVQRHFREKGLDVQKQAFTAIGIGDMGGDVFGNGMLLSNQLQLVAAFNHVHIFVDPNPDVEISYQERLRLFKLPRSSWSDYNRGLMSAGGGVFSRSAKSIVITPQMQERFQIAESRLTPTALIQALLKAPVDLLWNGGIGTYVKATSETHAEVGDKANDALRINGNELRCRVFGEGGNLGLTQQGRIEYCLNGGACNTDFIDNAAGVDCSDHEVNIKVLLDEVVNQAGMTLRQRNQLLAEMTNAVAELVLRNNYRQTQAITLAERGAAEHADDYRRFIRELENQGQLDRALEFLPTDELLLERQAQGKFLTRPELSVLLSYAKVVLKEQLARSEVATDPAVAASLSTAFPVVLRQRFNVPMQRHILRDEIVATQLANDMVNTMGIHFCADTMQVSGASAAQVARAYVAARDIYRLEEQLQAVEALDYVVAADVQQELMLQMIGRVRRATLWFLRHRRSGLDVFREVSNLGPLVHELMATLPQLLTGDAHQNWLQTSQRLIGSGVPEGLAQQAAIPVNLYTGLSMVDVAAQSNEPIGRVMALYLALCDQLGLHWFARQIATLKTNTYWQAIARDSYIEDLESQLRTLTLSLLLLCEEDASVGETVDRWLLQHGAQVGRWRVLLNELQTNPGTDFALFSVALRELQELAKTSQSVQPVFTPQ